MSTFELAVWLLGLVHVVGGSLYNRYRINRLLQYFSAFRGALLSEQEFLHLRKAYTASLAPYRLFPRPAVYPALYSDEAFASFCHTSKRIIAYVYGVLIAVFLTICSLN
ncbi:hypothetical protein [Hymenobacter sp. B1770]|uniref:hypothetical protein n=1 Tax=Hymenobacter sp. B1770 TaxID=1718788 RepID=UPI003CF7C26B